MPRQQLILASLFLLFSVDNCWCEVQPSASPFVENGLVYQVRQVNGGRKIGSFNSYKDVVLTEYKVAPETVSAIFGFAATSTPKGCSAQKTISIYIQHGGFPLFPMNNATFPKNVFANRTTIPLEYPATDVTWKVTLPVPRTGSWFSAVFIKESVSHIKQTGLFATCEVSYVSSFLTSTYPDSIIELSSGEKRQLKSTPGTPSHQLFKMCLMEGRYDVIDVLVHSLEGGPLSVKARSDGLPTVATANASVHSIVCQTGLCTMTFVPIQAKCQYVYVDFEDSSQVSFSLVINAVQCRKPANSIMTEANMVVKKKLKPNHRDAKRPGNQQGETYNTTLKITDVSLVNESFYHETSDSSVGPLEQPKCPYVIDMARLDLSPSFTSSFGLNHYTWPSTEYLFLPKSLYSDTILRFDILPYKDTGGTLHVALNLTDAAVADLRNLTIVACLNLGQGSRFNIETTCQGPVLKLNETQLYSEVLIPYPEIGTWHLNVQGRPLVEGTSNPMVYVPLLLTAKLDQCVKGSCGQYGTCRVVLNSGVLITSACVCSAGWRGWDCSDGTNAESTADLIMAVVFLTISNLVFIPAAMVALKRQYYTEAVVYLSTCFFSSFYHACDQPVKRLALCIMDYGVLQFCDFYVSILSFWVTIVAMADLPAHFKGMVHTAGCIGIALGVEYERTGLWVFAVPALVGIVILATSWGFRSYRMRKIAPQKRYWFIHFLPGFLFTAIGLVLFAFVETKSNYKFVHSVWHIVMALAVICFLPPIHHRLDGKYPKLRAIGTESDLSTTGSNLSQDLLKSRNSESPLSSEILVA